LSVALAESSMASDHGISVDLAAGGVRTDRLLFAEGGSRIVVSVKAECVQAWESLVGAAMELPITPIGVVTDQPSLVIKVDQRPCLDLSVQQCRDAHAMALPRRIEADVEVTK